MVYDGHVHTPFCPHGTADPFEEYIEKAISLGLKGMTFTEHAPLPYGFTDPTPEQDSGMKSEELLPYFETLKQLQSKYKHQITINIGLEVDYIEEFERETRELLDEWGDYLDDAILSVHFLKNNEKYFCLDFSPEMFEELAEEAGSISKVYEAYYKTVEKAILSDLGVNKPKRIGHLTLIRKFQKKFPVEKTYEETVVHLLDLMKRKHYELDYNGAGFSKPLCKEPYPPAWVINEAVKRNIPLIYGSDAHSVKGMAQGFQQLYLANATTSPSLLKG
ncbi:histidinol-phosphatase [Pueribacillus theae]|uniref:Histidinol-phosphatase n=1 Tax=Pueribacillus theae TaxID=2171751 RepID=A0A2U1K0W1_9BACI|nr:histidinol-phosphatase HisJ [Pueribacillus theae]PWA11150.1 histidinol-phosphatase [Pueribacillus theae]